MSNFGQIALTIVGTVVGAYFGNPELGFALGSLAGNALFPTQLPNGPKITDNRTTTATVGEPVPIGFGTFSVSGTVIDLLPFVQHESEQGSKGGPQQKLFAYTQTIAIGLCERVDDDADADVGAIAGMLRVWENGTLLYDVRPQLQANTATGQVAETDDEFANRQAASAAYATTFTLYLGDELQTPDPTLEAYYGVGNQPPHRGLAYVVFPDRKLQNAQGLRHPNFQFEVFQSGTANCVDQPMLSNGALYDWGGGDDPTNPRNVNTFQILSVDGVLSSPPAGYNTVQHASLSDATTLAEGWYGVSLDLMGYGLWGYDDRDDSQINIEKTGGPSIDDYPDALSVQLRFNWLQPDYLGIGFFAPGTYSVFSPSPKPYESPGVVWWQDGGLSVCETAPDSDDFAFPPWVPPWTHGSRGGGHWFQQLQDCLICVNRNPSAPIDPCDSLPPAPIDGYCIRDDGRFISSSGWQLESTHNYNVLWDSTGHGSGVNRTGYPLNPCLRDDDPNYTDEAFWAAAYNDAVAAGDLPPGLLYATNYPKQQAWAYSMDLTVCEGVGAGVSIGEIIRACCKRAGLPSIDAADMDTIKVGGYQVSSLSSAADIIAPTRMLGFWDCIESAGGLRFQGRGKEIVAALTDEDIGAFDASDTAESDPPPRVQVVRMLDEQLPRRIRLHYIAVQRDYQDGEQDSDFRITTPAVQDTDVSLPIAIDDTQALRAAQVAWAAAWAERESISTAVDQAWLALEEGDCISIPIDGFTQRARIVSSQNSSGILRKLSLVSDDERSFVSEAVAQPQPYQPPILALLADTIMELLDLPALQDSDSSAGFYVAVQKDPDSGNAWKGAQIYESIDGGLTYAAKFPLLEQTPLGTIVGAVPASQFFTWDDDTQITVDVAGEDFGFESRTDDAVLAGANAAAMGADGRWEIVQFATAEQLTATQWRLSRLLRGRRGTEHALGSSIAGDRFVMLSLGTLGRISLSSAEIGALRYYKAVSIGAAFSSGIAQTFAGHGEALRPFSPVDPQANYDITSGNIVISWTRRDRLGRTLMSGVDMPNSDPPLAFEIDIFRAGASPYYTNARTLASAGTSVLYEAADIFSDFGTTPPDQLRVAIYQISPIIGRGTPALALLELGSGIFRAPTGTGLGGSGSSDAPPEAIAAGYLAHTFQADTFDTDTVDMGHTRVSGFQWYLYDAFSGPPSPSQITLNGDGSATIEGSSASHNSQIWTAARAPGGNTTVGPWVGNAFGGGAYIRARFKFDPSLVNGHTANGWPAFWSLALDASVLWTSHWQGQASNYRHQIEADFFEYLYSIANAYSCAMHDWYGVQGVTCPPGFCQQGFTTGESKIIVPAGFDFNAYHDYGWLWIPATDTTLGSATSYLDGVAQHTKTWQKFVNDGSKAPPAAGQPWAFGVLDTQRLVLIAGSGIGQPLTIKRIDAWQRDTSGNLSF